MKSSDSGPAVIFMPGLLNGGGAERYAVGLASALQAHFDSVVLATDHGTKHDIQRQYGVLLNDVEVVHLPTMPSWSKVLPNAVFTLVEDARWMRTLRRLSPSLFVNCLYTSELPGLGPANLYVCHFPHWIDRDYSPWIRALYMRLMGWLRRILVAKDASFLTNYRGIIANSAFTSEQVAARWGREAQLLYPPCTSMMVDGSTKANRILAVGRFEEPVSGVPNKRHDVLVRAFCDLEDLHAQGWELHLAGACPPRSEPYLDHLRRLSGPAPVYFHPNVSFAELRQLYSSAKIYWHAQGFGEQAGIQPETQEHFGITTVEAMSAGAVPVVIDTAGPREVVLPVVGARRWTTTDGLLEATRQVAALDEAAWGSVSSACIRRATDFNVESFGKALSSVLRKVSG